MTAFLRPEKTQTKPCRVLGRPTHSPLQTSQLSFYFCLNNICCRHIFQGLRTFAAVKDLHCSSCLQHIPTINQALRLLLACHTGAPCTPHHKLSKAARLNAACSVSLYSNSAPSQPRMRALKSCQHQRCLQPITPLQPCPKLLCLASLQQI